MQVLNIHGPGDVRLDPASEPDTGAHDVLLAVAACGICGSDLTFIKLGGVGAQDRAGPMPLGHEAAGVVLKAGAAVEGIAPGMRMILNPMIADSVIGNGGDEGAFTEKLLIRGAKLNQILFPMPDGMDFTVGALAEPLAVSLHGVNRGQVKSGDKAVVFGAGPIGLGMVLWLRRRGLSDVVAVDLSPARLERACAMGATATILAGKEDLAERLAALHGRTSVMGMPCVGTDVFFDAAGGPGIIPDVIRIARMHARLVITAVYSEPVALDLTRFLMKEMHVTSAIGYPDEFPDVIAMLAEMGEEAKNMISHRYAFDDIVEGLTTARSRDSGKVMIEFAVG